MKCEHGITPWWDCDPCRGSATFGDDPIRPYFDEELGTEITSRGERRKLMREQALEYRDVSKKRMGKIYVDLHR